MKVLENTFVSVTIVVFGLILNFNACSEQSPLKSDSESSTSLAKSINDQDRQSDDFYPQSASKTYSFFEQRNGYHGGEFQVPNGSEFCLNQLSLTPPPEIPFGDDVTITMTIDKDTVNNLILFTFDPFGCRFDPPAKVIMDYSDLGITSPKLYLIDANGNYIEQQPEAINIIGKWIRIYINHFSRYAIGAE